MWRAEEFLFVRLHFLEIKFVTENDSSSNNMVRAQINQVIVVKTTWQITKVNLLILASAPIPGSKGEKQFKGAYLPEQEKRQQRKGYAGQFSIRITNKNTSHSPLNYIVWTYFMNFINVLQIDT